MPLPNVRSLFKRRKTPDRLILCGLDACGKTTLLYRWKLDQQVVTIPTIGFNVEDVSCEQRNFEVWDIDGTPGRRPLFRHYVNPDSVFLFLHDTSTSGQRMEDSIEALHAYAKSIVENGGRRLCLALTKQDLLEHSKRGGIVDDLMARLSMELAEYADDIVWRIINAHGLSAATGEGCFELLSSICGFLNDENSVSDEAVYFPLCTGPKMDHSSSPSEEELRVRAGELARVDLEPKDSWDSSVLQSYKSSNHGDLLRAAFSVLVPALAEGGGVLQAASALEEHRKCTARASCTSALPTRHRSLTVFWLYHINIAIQVYKRSKSAPKDIVLEDFGPVLLASPWLMNEKLVHLYYSDSLLLDDASKEFWRHPDLKDLALPVPTLHSDSLFRQVTNPRSGDDYRLARFGFAVLKYYSARQHRRGWVVKHALSALQTSILQIRATCPSIPPYSETQAYFWIQIIHTAFSLSDKPIEGIRYWTFHTFSQHLHIVPSEWKKYYSPKVWNSMEARISFVPPDVKSLPSAQERSPASTVVINGGEQSREYALGQVPEAPSAEELSFLAAVGIEEAREVALCLHPRKCTSHAHILLYFHSKNDELRRIKAGIASPEPILTALSDSVLSARTHQLFWLNMFISSDLSRDAPLPPAFRSHTLKCQNRYRAEEQVKVPCDCVTRTAALGDTILKTGFELEDVGKYAEAKDDFGDLIRSHLWLIHEDLWQAYYSPGRWHSQAASEKFVAPDRREIVWLIDVVDLPQSGLGQCQDHLRQSQTGATDEEPLVGSVVETDDDWEVVRDDETDIEVTFGCNRDGPTEF